MIAHYSDITAQWEKIAVELGRMRLVGHSRVRSGFGSDGQRAGIAKSYNEPEGAEQTPRHFCRRMKWPNGPHWDGITAGAFSSIFRPLHRGCLDFADRTKHQTV